VSHLTCLSKHFLTSQGTNNGLVPRGGTCTSCHAYTLWGDIVRGCYRRLAGAINEHDILDNDDVDLFESDLEPGLLPVSKPHQGVKRNKTKDGKTTIEDLESSSEGEHFDLEISSSEEN